MLFSAQAAAVLQHFAKNKVADGWHFQYQWLDHERQPQQFDFTLPFSAISAPENRTYAYSAQAANHFRYNALARSVQSSNPKLVSIQLQPTGKSLSWQIRSNDQAQLHMWRNKLKNVSEQANADFLQQHRLELFEDHSGQRVIKQQHVNYAQSSLPLLTPIQSQLLSILGKRLRPKDLLAFVLSWLQSMPYHDLETGIEGVNKGFISPIDVINNNYGDCESKSVLLLALAKSLLPRNASVMLFLPDHTIIGVAIGKSNDLLTVKIDDNIYTLMDPTGPALLPVGELSPEVKMQIESGLYRYQRW